MPQCSSCDQASLFEVKEQCRPTKNKIEPRDERDKTIMEDLLKSFWVMAATIVEGGGCSPYCHWRCASIRDVVVAFLRTHATEDAETGCTLRRGCWSDWISNSLAMSSARQSPPLGRTLDNWHQSLRSVRFLSYFLDKDIEKLSVSRESPYRPSNHQDRRANGTA